MNDHPDTDLHVAQYLASIDVGTMTDVVGGQVMEIGAGPPIFLGLLPPEPDEAIGIMGPWQADVYEENPTTRVMVVFRGEPWDRGAISSLASRVYDNLHEKIDLPLTATQTALLCRRIVNDAPAQDENKRWVRVDTYEMRMAVPT